MEILSVSGPFLFIIGEWHDGKKLVSENESEETLEVLLFIRKSEVMTTMQCLIGNPNWLVVAASLTLLLPLGSAQTLSLIPSIEAFSGVYVQEVPTSSIFYTTVSPLVYGFKVSSASHLSI